MIGHINIKAVQKEMRDFNFNTAGYTFDIPFLILQGESDIITPVESAKNFTKRIQAPKKDLPLFHTPAILQNSATRTNL